MAGPFYFAWVASGDVAFDPITHAVYDEVILGIEVTHAEGDHATCRLNVRNPKVGLLGTDRYRWAILAWDNGSEIVPLFKGRIIGVTSGITGELATFEFMARPDDYEDQKSAVADSLKTLPQYDPVWFEQGGTVDNDQVLEPYSALWYVDRVDLSVGTSDIISGESGTIELTAADHEYDGLDVSYSEKPILRVRAKGTVTWTQQGEGLVDLSEPLTVALRQASPMYPFPAFASLTSDGLISTWPKVGDSFGEGWTVEDSEIKNVSRPSPSFQNSPYIQLRQGNGFYKPYTFHLTYYARPQQTAITEGDPTNPAVGISPTNWFVNPIAQYTVDFPVPALHGTVVAKWRANRKRTETISFTLESDLQELDNDLSVEATEETVELSSDYVGQLVDSFSLDTQVVLANLSTSATLVSSQDLVAGTVYEITSDHLPLGTTFTAPSNAGAENLAITLSEPATDDAPDGEDCTVATTGAYPIGDLRRNSYFKSDRGRQTFECLLYLCRAKLLSKSRAVEIRIKPTAWAVSVAATLRHSVLVHDDRLPGGVATGKVTDLRLSFSAGKYDSEITIKCPVGKGGTLGATNDGDGTYAFAGYMAPGYQAMEDATVSLDVGDIQYESYDAAVVTDDDGVDLFNLSPSSAVKSIVITNGLKDQCRIALQNIGTTWSNNSVYGDPIKAVEANPTTVDVKLVSMTGDFLTEIAPVVSKLMIPRGIDLEAV